MERRARQPRRRRGDALTPIPARCARHPVACAGRADDSRGPNGQTSSTCSPPIGSRRGVGVHVDTSGPPFVSGSSAPREAIAVWPARESSERLRPGLFLRGPFRHDAARDVATRWPADTRRLHGCVAWAGGLGRRTSSVCRHLLCSGAFWGSPGTPCKDGGERPPRGRPCPSDDTPRVKSHALTCGNAATRLLAVPKTHARFQRAS